MTDLKEVKAKIQHNKNVKLRGNTMVNKTAAPPKRIALCIGAAVALAAPFAMSQSVIEEIVVTAQKRAESIQDVPIAVSAFSESDISSKHIDTGIDLQNYVPNLSYTGTGSFSIRGVGAAVGGTTGDVGVGIHNNNVPIIVNRTTTGEMYDMERIEVLRGPQGTLYGRNATGGVINYLAAKPDFDGFSGSAFAEYGSFDSTKVNGFVNLPATEMLSFRLAASFVQRDGYTENIATGNNVDGRDEWSTRFSTTFAPNDSFSSTLMWEHYEEDSSRNGGARLKCIKDSGPDTVGSTSVDDPRAKLYLSRGCATGSIYENDANDYYNSVATFGGRYAFVDTAPLDIGAVDGDVFRNQTQSNDPRESSYYIDPEYVVTNDFVSWDNSFYLNEALQLNLLLGWAEDKLDTRSGSAEADIGFLDTSLTPGGVFTDFQGGAANGVRTLTTTDNYTEQYSAELRLQSDYDGPLNFNAGLFYFNVERENILFIATNSTSIFGQHLNTNIAPFLGLDALFYFDETPDPRDSNYDGHQYFVSKTPYELESQAAFGEVYWDMNEELKLTVGLRYTDDQKVLTNTPNMLFIADGANGTGTAGHPDGSIFEQSVDFQEWTGRIVLDWRPDVEFSDDTLVYASFANGYKSGGFNSPDSAGIEVDPYLPEFVNSFEIGTKNVFGGGKGTANLTAFYYDYTDYQISVIEQFSTRNDNIDAEVFGIEFEGSYELVDGLVFDGSAGWLNTEIQGGTSFDPFDRLQGRTDLTYLAGPSSGCVVSTAQMELLIQEINAGTVSADVLSNTNLSFLGQPPNICQGGTVGGIDFSESVSAGEPADIKGNELPNSPKLSYTVGAAYYFGVGGDWDAMVRADYSWKDDSYVSHFNGPNYELRSWQNANLTFEVRNAQAGVTIQAYAKNVLNDDDTIVGYDVGGQGLGLSRNVTYLDPRLYGINVRYGF